MAGSTTVRLGDNSPEQVAYKLLHDVARAEKKIDATGHVARDADRKWILDTYAECLDAVLNRRSYTLDNV